MEGLLYDYGVDIVFSGHVSNQSALFWTITMVSVDNIR